MWRVIEDYKVDCLYTSPTALRALRKEDPDGDYMNKYNLSSLKHVMFAGERTDIPTLQWFSDRLPKGTLLNDNYW